MPTMNMIQALNDAHKVLMRRDEDVVVFGEDAGYFGGVFRVTEGLQKEFGKTRVFDAPISEGGIVAMAVGMAAYGIKPLIEIQFADYIYPGYDQIVSEVAKMRYRTAGEWTMPMVIRTPYGGGISIWTALVLPSSRVRSMPHFFAPSRCTRLAPRSSPRVMSGRRLAPSARRPPDGISSKHPTRPRARAS